MNHSHCALVLLLAITLSACGLGRTVLQVETPEAVGSATSARVFKIARIQDGRRFQARPPKPNMPSLNGDDLSDAALLARAVGRKRGSFGKARGDYVLPENSTVSDVVRACVVASASRAGATLVDERDPRFAAAIPLDVTIDEFWSWLRLGMWVVRAHFDARLTVKAPVAEMNDGVVAIGHAEMARGAMTDERWREVIEAGLVDLTNNLSTRMKEALASEASSGSAP